MSRLLVVDDDPDILDLLIFKLERAGFDVTSASDGDGAIKAFRAQRPDLVVLDWTMPGADGLEVCAELRRHPETADVPVILLTAKAQEADLQRGLAASISRYMTKPFSPDELVRAVRDCLVTG